MLGFTHTYSSIILAVRRLETLEEIASLMGTAREDLHATQEYIEGSRGERAELMKRLVTRYTAFTFGFRIQRSTPWLSEALEAGDVFTLQSGGYPSRYVVRGRHVLPQLQLDVMTEVEDWLRPAELPAPDDWVLIEEWDQS